MSDNFFSITGNVTRDPELRFTNSGKAVVSFGIAHKPYSKDRDTDTSFFDVTAWDTLAENAAESLTKGMRATVTGSLRQETWQTDDGSKRSKVVLVAQSIAPDLRFATARVESTYEDKQPVKKSSSRKSVKEQSFEEEPF